MVIKFTATTTSKDFETALKPELEKPIEHFKKELIKLRTGRANTAMVENIKVLCYGESLMPLKELAAISAPDARLIVIQPWDKSVISNIEKAILESELGITPLNDGDVIRLQLPFMSTSQRDDLIKVIGKKLEETRVAIRNIRKDFQNAVRDSEKAHIFDTDYSKILLGILQDYVDKYIKMAEDQAAKKEQEIKAG
jgi:ribosome recycling factor